MFVRNNKNYESYPNRLFGRKSVSVKEAYRKIELRIQNRKNQQTNKTVPYSQRYPQTHKIYSSRVADTHKSNSHREGLQVIKRARTASSRDNYRNYEINFPKTEREEEKTINLFTSESRRQMVFDRISQRKKKNTSAEVIRTKSARTFSNHDVRNGIALRNSQAPNIIRTNQKDQKIERAVLHKLNTDLFHEEKNNVRQNDQKRKNKQKIIIFEKGILLRNKY